MGSSTSTDLLLDLHGRNFRHAHLTGDVVEAEEHLRRAAVAGHAGAAANLGGLLMFVGDDAEAEMWCRRAVEAGSPNGERNLALILDRRERNDSPRD